MLIILINVAMKVSMHDVWTARARPIPPFMGIAESSDSTLGPIATHATLGGHRMEWRSKFVLKSSKKDRRKGRTNELGEEMTPHLEAPH